MAQSSFRFFYNTSDVTVFNAMAAALASYDFANPNILCPSAIKLNACAFWVCLIPIADGTNANTHQELNKLFSRLDTEDRNV